VCFLLATEGVEMSSVGRSADAVILGETTAIILDVAEWWLDVD
jgi:hypothetical protein